MTQTYLKGTAEAVHRIDLPCQQTGFTPPPCDVHLKVLPSPTTEEGWTLLAHAAAGKADALSRWLRLHPGLGNVRVAPGIAPKVLRASLARLPAPWATAASFVKVHHLDLSPDGNAAWFTQGARDQVWALVQRFEAAAGPDPAGPAGVRCHPVSREARVTRRQFEALATAVSLGYYEIPHRLDLRALAARTGLSLGSVSELLRRAEGAVLTHYIDSRLMEWPADLPRWPADGPAWRPDAPAPNGGPQRPPPQARPGPRRPVNEPGPRTHGPGPVALAPFGRKDGAPPAPIRWSLLPGAQERR